MLRRVASANLCLLAVVLLIGGCAARQQTHDLLSQPAIAVPASAIAAKHEIFVATTRARAEIPNEVFSGQRSPVTSYARVDITVPAIHKTGAIERRKKRQKPDPAKFFVANDVAGYESEAAFSNALRADIAARGGRALVFIHGYNTAFDSAIYRVTQIAHDAGYSGTPVLFSWASGGKTVDYVYDSNSASAARDALEETLRLVARSGAKRIDIIAHSMGNWVTMEALRQLAITGDRDLDGKLGDVVLASPDIDVDVFKTQMARYGKPKKPFFLFLSDDDRALRLSSLIAGNKPRLGDYGKAQDIAEYGFVVVDLSNVESSDRLNHMKFADNPLLVKMLGDGLQRSEDLTANEREVTDRINGLAQGLGQTLTSAAEIVITTPISVLNVAVGGN
ncbi:alpha/beta hydrolase [Mesorhizobium sp. AaZ16]|uniref:alpha/beta hydrolase n=1 Tax=Mesorhizobium sp. AaZ16 TaxID=3402289 RepID=UPI00374F812A